MRVLVFHGYLLHGTGSNVYNASLGQAFVAAGHDLHLLCQEREPFDLDWVDAAGDWDGGTLRVRVRREPVHATVYRPDIGGLLPVYVADRYDGIAARPFPELDDAQLERYLERNVAAAREVALRVRPDVALANHLVMGPLVLARALEGLGVPYAVKIHGSALEYTVKPHPRFMPFAREGLAGARGILVGSRHTAESLWTAMDDASVPARTRLGPPGVDLARFVPREPAAAAAGLSALAERLAAARPPAAEEPAPGTAEPLRAPGTSEPLRAPGTAEPLPAPGTAQPLPAPGSSEPLPAPGSSEPLPAPGTSEPLQAAPPSPAEEPAEGTAEPLAAATSSFARDPAEAARALATIELGHDRLVVFVGKLIGSKGVELLLAAWPLVAARVPGARLLVVGFGGFRLGLERLAARLAAGDLAAARGTPDETGAPLPLLDAFLNSLTGERAAAYRAAAPALRDRVAWAGRLDHEELPDVLAAAEAMVVPSTFPEAFGMVAAEAAACGALPVVAGHSGLAEVARSLAAEVPAPARDWLAFALGPDAVRDLAAHLVSWLEAPAPLRAAAREALVRVARERYGWGGVARGVLAAAQGRLDELAEP